MSAQGSVRWIHPEGGLIGIALDDGTHVLIEPLQAENLPVGTRVMGNMHCMGEVTLKQIHSNLPWRGFILAYDLSEAAVTMAMR